MNLRTTVILALAALLTLSAASLAVGQAYLWDGTHWKEMTQDLKVAYIKGIGNMADFETAVGGSGRAACISNAFVLELKTQNISQIIQEVDKFYQENPNKLNTSVIEVILRRCTALCPPETKAGEKK